MSSKVKIVFGSVVILGLLITSWIFFRSVPSKNIRPPKTTHPESTQPKEAGPVVKEVSLDTAAQKPSHFLNVVKNCFPELVNQVQSPKQFVQNWKSSYPKATESVDYIHYFFKDTDGNEMRAQILYSDSNGRAVRELKLFKVLSDGLPDPITIGKEDRFNPSNTTLTKYIDFDSIFETQKKWSMTVSEKISLEVEESNSEITEFQLLHEGKIFRCHEGDCECKIK